MKIIPFLFALSASLSQFSIYGQPKPCSACVTFRGQVPHHLYDKIQLACGGYFGQQDLTIPVKPDGSFSGQIRQDEGMHDCYLVLPQGNIGFFAQSGDTIDITWDSTATGYLPTISSPDPGRAADLQCWLRLNGKYNPLYNQLILGLYRDRAVPDSVKFKRINDLYNREMNDLLADTMALPPSIHKLINDVYYFYAGLLLDNGLSGYDLTTDYPVKSVWQLTHPHSLKAHFPGQKVLNKEIFLVSDTYREYIYHYIIGIRMTLYNSFQTILYKDPIDKVHWNSVRKRYYICMAEMESYPMRDWLATKIIMDGFRNNNLIDAEEVMNDFLPKCTIPTYRDSLTNYCKALKKTLWRGREAPAFTLQDANGREVSLSDFKGKVVYIDFWGVHCGPCIYDIRTDVPSLHKKYAGKDVVFLNVCVEGSIAQWKATLENLGMDGVNLLTPGVESPAGKAYNISGIPHYVLIDRQGKIFNSNALPPHIMAMDGFTELDQLLLSN